MKTLAGCTLLIAILVASPLRAAPVTYAFPEASTAMAFISGGSEAWYRMEPVAGLSFAITVEVPNHTSM